MDRALQLMSPGSKYKLYIPQNLARCAGRRRDIPPYSAPIFDVELISIKPGDAPTPGQKRSSVFLEEEPAAALRALPFTISLRPRRPTLR